MKNTFEHKVRSTAVAGGWVIVVAVGFLVLNWLIYLVATSARRAWFLSSWGRDVSWFYVQNV